MVSVVNDRKAYVQYALSYNQGKFLKANAEDSIKKFTKFTSSEQATEVLKGWLV
jgi:hypothetical protein